MRFWNIAAVAASLMMTLSAGAALADQCTSCQDGQQYCGVYNADTGQWESGSYQACTDAPPPPPSQPDCHNQPGHNEYNSQYVGSTFCRAVRPGSNECIARGSATVLIDNLRCVYNQFDGCGQFTGTFEEDCGTKYDSCGC